MVLRTAALVMLAALQPAACDIAPTREWPDRAGRAGPEMLIDVVRWQQLENVKPSTGTEAWQCFTDLDLESFVDRHRPEAIVRGLKHARDWNVVAAALRALPPEPLAAALAQARLVARPTWRQLGYIDPSGRGQTEAGHIAELMIADAIVNAFLNMLGPPATSSPSFSPNAVRNRPVASVHGAPAATEEPR